MSNVKVSKEELLKKANKPAEDAMQLHPFYKGKVEVSPKCCIRDINDFAIWYTPGVAAVCKDIQGGYTRGLSPNAAHRPKPAS